MSNSAALSGLVESITKNKKFGGLLNYSVNCVVSLITPPNPEAALNTTQLAKSGGLGAIISAIELHPGNENLLDATKAILKASSQDEECLRVIQESGICSRLLELSAKNPETVGLRQIVLDITDKCTNTKPAKEKLVADGAIPTLLAMMSTDAANPDAHSLDLLRKNISVLSQLSAVDGAVQEMINAGGLAQCLELLKSRNDDEELCANALMLLLEASNNGNAIDMLKQNSGVDTIVGAMEKHYAVSSLLDAGGKILGQLCSQEDIAKAIDALKSKTTSEAEKRYAAAIVSNLAFDDEMLNAIVEGGGIKTLLALIESGDAPSNIADICVRAIGRLGTSAEGLEQLLSSNAIKSILAVVENDNVSAESLASALLTFKTLSTCDEGVEAIVNCGGLDSLLRSIDRVNCDEHTMKIALDCLDSMMTQPKIFNAVNTENNLAMVFDTLQKYPGSKEIAKSAASIFSRMCQDDDRLNEMSTADNVNIVLKCLRLNKTNKEVVINCFEVISKLIYRKVKFLEVAPDFAQIVAGALKLNESSSRVITLGTYVCGYTFDSEVLQQQRKNLKKCSRDLKFIDTDMSTEYSFIAETIYVLEYFGLKKPAIDGIGDDGFAKDFVKFVSELATLCVDEGKPAHNKLYVASMAAMTRLVASSQIFANKISLSGVVKSVSKFKDDHINSPAAVAGAHVLAEIMKTSNLSSDAITRLLDDGSIAYILETSAANSTDSKLKQSCIEALRNFCKDEETASRVVRSVGPRVIIASGVLDTALKSLADNDEHVLNSLALLTAASKIPKLVNEITDNGVLESLQGILANSNTVWFEAMDSNTGKIYFYNKKTGETKWTKPDADVSKAFVPATHLFNLVTSKVGHEQFVKQGGISSLISMTNVLLANSGDESRNAVLSSLETLSSLAKTNCQECLDKGAIGMLTSALDKYPADPSVVNKCTAVIHQISKTPEGKAALVESGLISKCVELLRSDPNNKVAGKAIVMTLDNLCSDPSTVKEVAALDGSAAVVQSFIALNPDDTACQAAGDRILSATSLRNRKSTVTLDESVESVTPGYANRNPKDVLSALQQITRTSLLDETAMEKMIDDGVANNVLSICNDESVSADITEEAVEALTAMVQGKRSGSKWLKVKDLLLVGNNIPQLLNTARRNKDNPTLLRKIMRLLTRLAVDDKFKLKIISQNGIDFVVEIIMGYLDNVPLLAACISVIANLSYNNLDVAKSIMKAGAVSAVEAVMQKHLEQMSLLSKCLTTLSNLMYSNDEHTRIICKSCGDEIVHMIRQYGAESNVLSSGLRALGTLVYCEDNIGIIVGEGATKAIVDGMKKNQENEDTLIMAVHCLSNLSAANMPTSEAPDSVGKDFHPPRHGEPTLQVMVEEGAIDVLLQTMRDFEYNGALGISCMEVLHGLCETPEYAKKAFDLGAATIILNLLQQHDWDHEIVAAGFGCLAILGETVIYELDAGIDKVLTDEDVKNLASLISNIDSDEYQGAFVSICTVLKLFLSDDDHGDESGEFFVQNGVLKALVHLMKTHMNVDGYLLECTPVLSAFAHIDKYSHTVAQSVVHIVTAAMKLHTENSKVLTKLFDLMGSLAFENENLPLIVQYDGPSAIVDAICANPTDPSMVLSAIHTLENIAMCNDEYCQIILAHGGRDCCEALAEAYEDNQEVLAACKSTMLTFNAMLTGKDNYTIKSNNDMKSRVRGMTLRQRTASQQTVNTFLQSYRRRILDGCTVTKHHKSNAPRTRKVYVTEDFRLICWKEVGGKKAKGELAFKEVQEIIKGATTKALCRKHLLRAKPKPEHCFTIKARTRDLDLEAENEAQRDLWVKMLHACIDFRNHKGLD